VNLGNVIIFGDSYSTYKGYIPEGYAVFYSGERVTPPDLPNVEKTWWKIVLDANESNLIQNNSWSGSTIGYTGYDSADCSKSSSFIYRLEKLIDEGFFEENIIDLFLCSVELTIAGQMLLSESLNMITLIKTICTLCSPQ